MRFNWKYICSNSRQRLCSVATRYLSPLSRPPPLPPVANFHRSTQCRCGSGFSHLDRTIYIMLREVEGSLLVVKKLNENREVRTSEIATSLLKQLSHFKACRNGYLIEVTKLISIGNGECKFSPQYIIFPVNFLCNFFTPVEGEVMDGVVYRVIGGGVFIKSGPMSYVYLSDRKMPNYSYVLGEDRNPRYVGVDLSRIEIGVLVRFRVLAAKWVEDKYREFRVLASIDGDGLGPVSMNGFDGVDFEMPCSNII